MIRWGALSLLEFFLTVTIVALAPEEAITATTQMDRFDALGDMSFGSASHSRLADSARLASSSARARAAAAVASYPSRSARHFMGWLRSRSPWRSGPQDESPRPEERAGGTARG